MPLDAVTLDSVVEQVAQRIEAGRGGAIITPNLEITRQYRRSGALRRVFEDIDLLVADGMPIVWAARLQGTPVPERVTGTALIWALSTAAAGRGFSVALAGGHPGVAQRAADRLRSAEPALRASAHPCFVAPRRDLEAALAPLSAALAAEAPDIVFAGLPLTSQIQLATMLRERLPTTWFVGVGSAFDFVNGDRSRAPEWLQRAGLEWLHRLGQQPWLWRRYLVHGLPFAGFLFLHVLGARVRSPERSPGAPRRVQAP